MFALIVTLKVRPESRDDFLRAIAANAEASVRDEPGCRRFDVCQDQDHAESFILYEVYEDAGAFEEHRRTPHFQAWRLAAAQCLVPGSQHNVSAELLITDSH